MPSGAARGVARVLRRERRIVTTRFEFLLLVLACIASGPPAVLYAKSGLHTSHLRVLDPDLKELMQAGRNASPMVRALVDRLEAGDVVVYVDYAQLPTGLHGQLTFVSAAAGLRYVMVKVVRGLARARTIAILGHELQHAVEVADHPKIVDHKSLAREYARFGLKSRPGGVRAVAFDTVAAIVTGRQVSRELAATVHAAGVATD